MLRKVPGAAQEVIALHFGEVSSEAVVNEAAGHGELAQTVSKRIIGSEGGALQGRLTLCRFADASAATSFVASSAGTGGRFAAAGLPAWLDAKMSVFEDEGALQEECDAFMEQHDNAKALLAAARSTGAEVDEEGWSTVVGKKGANSAAGPGQDEEAPMRRISRRGKKKGALEVSRFYRFQAREAKIERMKELRSQFEQDKAKIARMRAGRVFKP